MSLTSDQRLVAESDGHVMACALPGSGKSHTLVSLADNLLKKDKTYRLLVITFTNAATAEISERLQHKLGNAMRRVHVSTFHKIALEQMKRSGMAERLCIGAEQHLMVERAIRYTNLVMEHDEAMGWVEHYGRMAIVPDEDKSEGATLYRAYGSLLHQNGKADFNMICRWAYLRLAEGKVKPWPATHILVDEFQDTDEIQYLWLYEHGIRGAKITAVGDDDQAIYGWRGAAGYRNLVTFQRDFSADAYVLRICFRCTKEILMSAKRLIEHNTDRVLKPMESGREGQGTVEVIACEAEREFELAIQTIMSSPDDWAVLARTNRQLDVMETFARSYNVPYTRLGGKSLWDDPSVAIYIRLIYVALHPEERGYVPDVLAFLHEDESRIQSIRQEMAQRRVGFGELRPNTGGEWSRPVITLHELTAAWHQPAKGKVELIGRMSRILELVKNVRGDKGREPRLLETITDIVVGMDGVFKDRIASLARRTGGKSTAKTKEQKGVTLATMHAAKGLQWQNVWLVSSLDGVCPSVEAIAGETPGGIQEERRLFYVGMTRAIQRLVMSFGVEPNGKKGPEPSRFLWESEPTLTAAALANIKKVESAAA